MMNSGRSLLGQRGPAARALGGELLEVVGEVEAITNIGKTMALVEGEVVGDHQVVVELTVGLPTVGITQRG